jgi:hypothetical protein
MPDLQLARIAPGPMARPRIAGAGDTASMRPALRYRSGPHPAKNPGGETMRRDNASSTVTIRLGDFFQRRRETEPQRLFVLSCWNTRQRFLGRRTYMI